MVLDLFLSEISSDLTCLLASSSKGQREKVFVATGTIEISLSRGGWLRWERRQGEAESMQSLWEEVAEREEAVLEKSRGKNRRRSLES